MRKTKLYNIWLAIQSSLWFIPSVMILLAISLSFVSIWFDREMEYEILVQVIQLEEDSILSNFLIVGPEGARSVLSTVAGSMITVAGVTFSITIVTLTLASSQFGPRLLTNFMQDKSTQFVLGAFTATFIYCLLVLRSVQSTHDSVFVPTVSVNISVVLAIINGCILIYFIHNIGSSIKAENVISLVYRHLRENIDRIFKDIEIKERGGKNQKESTAIEPAEGRKEEIAAARDGYLQAIDHQALIDIGTRHDLLISLRLRAGNYVTHTTPLADVYHSRPLEECVAEEIQCACIYGYQRTPEQDIEFALHQLVEIALRSLSPSINDPFTTISCIDYLGSALCYLAGKQFPSPYCCDQNGDLRVITKSVKFGNMLDSAFNQIRQQCSSSVAVTIRLMDAYVQIARNVCEDHRRKELFKHAQMLSQSAESYLDDEHDRQDLEKRYRKVVSLIGREQT